MAAIVRATAWQNCGVIRIVPHLQAYAWGQSDAIPALLRMERISGPVAEAWFGAHESAPSALEGGGDLASLIAADPASTVGGDALPYLLKILAIASPLSLQVHPTAEQARVGFDNEEAEGVPVAEPTRTFRDSRHKPEMIVALTPLRLLVGMRPARDLADDLRGLGADALVPLVEGRESLLTYVMAVLGGARHDEVLERLAGSPEGDTPLGLAGRAARAFPGDPGALVALAMNAMVLQPGQACYVPPRMIHSYQSGLGVEIMANSDNVVRGGLTPKAVDISHLEAILDATPSAPVPPTVTRSGAATTYCAPVDEFSLLRVEGGTVPTPASARIVLALADAVVTCGADTLTLAAGQSAFIQASDGPAEITTDGVAFVALPGGAG
jgi:mannose-6-phosphate isomerase